MRLTTSLAAAALCWSVSDASRAVMAQTPPSATPLAFEVVSVKPNTTNDRTGQTMQWQRGGRFVAVHQTLRSLVSIGFQLPIYRIEGLPAWIDAEWFDIDARATREPVDQAEQSTLLRAILTERFGLVTRRETRELPIYTMTLAREDGRLGPDLKRSDVDCDAVTAARRASGERPPAAAGTPPACGAMLGIGSMQGHAVPLGSLTAMLAAQMGRMIVDNTGLTGRYDIRLVSSGTGAPRAVAPGGAAPADRPSLFTALPDQLGLKLEAGRGPVEIMVIERLERPTPD